jgi:hypothetical protein
MYMDTKLNVSLPVVKVKSLRFLRFAKEGIVLAPSIVITLHHLFPRQTVIVRRHTAVVQAHNKVQLSLWTS